MGACQTVHKAHSFPRSFCRFCAKLVRDRFLARSLMPQGFPGLSDFFCFVPNEMPPHTRVLGTPHPSQQSGAAPGQSCTGVPDIASKNIVVPLIVRADQLSLVD